MSASHGPGVPGLIPSGTISLVFTDVEGSTRRWDRDPQAMEAAMRRHDGLVRTALEEHGGYVFKTIAAGGVQANADDGDLAVRDDARRSRGGLECARACR